MTLEEFEKYAKEHNIFYCTKELQESCDDVVSRQAVIAEINDTIAEYIPIFYGRTVKIPLELDRAIMRVPPVRPQEQTGHWINRHIIASKTIDMIVCSECREEFSYDAETGISEYNYCPNCGARMVEPQESGLTDEMMEHYKKLAEHYNGGAHESIQDTNDGK